MHWTVIFSLIYLLSFNDSYSLQTLPRPLHYTLVKFDNEWMNHCECLECRFKGICACVGLGFQWRAMKFGLGWVQYGAMHRPIWWKRYERRWCFFCVVLWGLRVYFPEDISMFLIFSCQFDVLYNTWDQNWTDAYPCIVNTTLVLMSVMRLRLCNCIRCRYYWDYMEYHSPALRSDFIRIEIFNLVFNLVLEVL